MIHFSTDGLERLSRLRKSIKIYIDAYNKERNNVTMNEYDKNLILKVIKRKIAKYQKVHKQVVGVPCSDLPLFTIIK